MAQKERSLIMPKPVSESLAAGVGCATVVALFFLIILLYFLLNPGLALPGVGVPGKIASIEVETTSESIDGRFRCVDPELSAAEQLAFLPAGTSAKWSISCREKGWGNEIRTRSYKQARIRIAGNISIPSDVHPGDTSGRLEGHILAPTQTRPGLFKNSVLPVSEIIQLHIVSSSEYWRMWRYKHRISGSIFLLVAVIATFLWIVIGYRVRGAARQAERTKAK